ncbi:MAG TPA: hypothetical protein VEC01_14235 [Noviherbaspirillum sp.]|uniref:hypothetical protein n=1 Tax=Noviherbaspirillum sp. TaxID=1926288 RepID=UPI002D220538|nr:hypothetical protein [Noviherbaspirillum sp.]HYD96484.1 hypothetical protein [Noviherbaspirillum sp.]
MKILNIIWLFFALTSTAYAHGDEDHSKDGTPAAQAQSAGQPRVETFTEAFELVGQLQGKELSVFIDKYETNEPVLNGKLEVELNGLKSVGKYRPERGDYVIADEGFIKALAAPGKHALVFTLSAAEETDLLEGTLEVQPAVEHETNTQFPLAWAGAGLLAALALIALAAKRRRSTHPTGK